ncbi:MAG: hypothetical protein IKI69_07075 [Oscillospiraceae bacterium]|nr:hypothetical protein [Oscillospiraceae bacterium]
MRKYENRGLLPAAMLILMIVVLAICAIVFHSRGERVTGMIGCAPTLAILLYNIIRVRRITPEEWKKALSENDERNKLVQGKAALVSGVMTLAVAIGSLLYLAIRGQENDTALIILALLICVQVFSFLIAFFLFNKKL